MLAVAGGHTGGDGDGAVAFAVPDEAADVALADVKVRSSALVGRDGAARDADAAADAVIVIIRITYSCADARTHVSACSCDGAAGDGAVIALIATSILSARADARPSRMVERGRSPRVRLHRPQLLPAQVQGTDRPHASGMACVISHIKR